MHPHIHGPCSWATLSTAAPPPSPPPPPPPGYTWLEVAALRPTTAEALGCLWGRAAASSSRDLMQTCVVALGTRGPHMERARARMAALSRTLMSGINTVRRPRRAAPRACARACVWAGLGGGSWPCVAWCGVAHPQRWGRGRCTPACMHASSTVHVAMLCACGRRAGPGGPNSTGHAACWPCALSPGPLPTPPPHPPAHPPRAYPLAPLTPSPPLPPRSLLLLLSPFAAIVAGPTMYHQPTDHETCFNEHADTRGAQRDPSIFAASSALAESRLRIVFIDASRQAALCRWLAGRPEAWRRMGTTSPPGGSPVVVRSSPAKPSLGGGVGFGANGEA